MAPYLDAAFAAIDAEFGTFDRYAAEMLGMGEDARAMLCQRFVAREACP